VRRRRLASSLQPAAERAGLAPALARVQGRGCTFHCSAAPRADDKPSREGGSPENLPGQELDPNRAPPDDTPSGPSGAAKARPPGGPAPARPGGDLFSHWVKTCPYWAIVLLPLVPCARVGKERLCSIVWPS